MIVASGMIHKMLAKALCAAYVLAFAVAGSFAFAVAGGAGRLTKPRRLAAAADATPLLGRSRTSAHGLRTKISVAARPACGCPG